MVPLGKQRARIQHQRGKVCETMLMRILDFSLTSTSHIVMANFMFQFDWVKGFPDRNRIMKEKKLEICGKHN